MQTVTYGGTAYTEEVLSGMSTTDLADLYNKIAKETNAKTVNRFADKKSAVRRVALLLSYADGGDAGSPKGKQATPAAEKAPAKTKEARAKKKDTTPKEAKERKKRGRRFVFPVGEKVKVPTERIEKNTGRKAHRRIMFELCCRPKGADFQELLAETFGHPTSKTFKKPLELQDKGAYECLRLLHNYNNYGLRQDEKGRIYACTSQRWQPGDPEEERWVKSKS